MATFSGRVMVPNVQMGAEVRLRPSSGLERERRGDRVGIGIVLHQDQDVLGAFEVRPELLRAAALDGALDGGLDHAIPERGQGDRDRPGKRRPVLVAHHEDGCVGGGLGHGGEHLGVAGGPSPDDHGTAPALERLVVKGRVREIAVERAVAALAQPVPQRRPLDEIEHSLAREGHASREMTEQVVRADEHRPHQRFPGAVPGTSV